jgi:hypothetical protein
MVENEQGEKQKKGTECVIIKRWETNNTGVLIYSVFLKPGEGAIINKNDIPHTYDEKGVALTLRDEDHPLDWELTAIFDSQEKRLLILTKKETVILDSVNRGRVLMVGEVNYAAGWGRDENDAHRIITIMLE